MTKGPAMTTAPPYRFYAAEVSYFSGKVRPMFRYKEIPYEEIQPTPEVYREVIIARTGLGFIPVVVTPDDHTLQDTSDILDELERRFPDPPVYPPTPVQRVVAYLLGASYVARRNQLKNGNCHTVCDAVARGRIASSHRRGR